MEEISPNHDQLALQSLEKIAEKYIGEQLKL